MGGLLVAPAISLPRRGTPTKFMQTKAKPLRNTGVGIIHLKDDGFFPVRERTNERPYVWHRARGPSPWFSGNMPWGLTEVNGGAVVARPQWVPRSQESACLKMRVYEVHLFCVLF